MYTEPKIKLICVRHLDTPYSLNGTIQGKEDVELADHIAIPDNTLKKIKDTSVQGTYASTYKRTIQTAHKMGIDNPTESELLNEMDFKEFEGKQKVELLAHQNGAWKKTPQESALADSLNGLKNNIRKFINTLSPGTYLCFCHGCWIRAAYAMFELHDINQMNQFPLEPGDYIEINI